MECSFDAAAAVARGGGSPALRGALSAGLHARRRATAARWAAPNALALAALTYDLWYRCPGHSPALQLLELALALLLALAAGWQAVLLAARARPVSLTPKQMTLLGVQRNHLESSFQLIDSSSNSSGSSSARDVSGVYDVSGFCDVSGYDVSALSLSRTWGERGAAEGGANEGRSSPRAHTPETAPPDQFIADPDSLAEYLRRYERTRAVEGLCAGAWGAAGAGGGGMPAHYQLAAPADESSGWSGPGGSDGLDGSGGQGANTRLVWRRLDVDPQQLTQYNLNLRVWLHVTILRRLAREIDSVDEALAQRHLTDLKLGEVPPERLRRAAASPLLQQHVPSLRALLPYLEPFRDQRYVVQRIKELAVGGALSRYRWAGGGQGWARGMPTDAELLFHLFVTYMDACCGAPGEDAAFSSRHVVSGARSRCSTPSIERARTYPPHWVLRLGSGGASGASVGAGGASVGASVASVGAGGTSAGEPVSLPPGRNNLLHSILLLLAALRRAPHRVPLGPHALNLLWVIGGDLPQPMDQ